MNRTPTSCSNLALMHTTHLPDDETNILTRSLFIIKLPSSLLLLAQQCLDASLRHFCRENPRLGGYANIKMSSITESGYWSWRIQSFHLLQAPSSW